MKTKFVWIIVCIAFGNQCGMHTLRGKHEANCDEILYTHGLVLQILNVLKLNKKSDTPTIIILRI